MSTVEAPSKVAPTMDKLTDTWFEELRNALNSAKKWKQVLFSDERLGTKFELAYARMRKHLGDLEAAGVDVKSYQDQYDRIVKSATEAKDKQRPGGIKDALADLNELDKELVSDKKKQKALLEKRSWNSTREKVAARLVEAEDDWLTQKSLERFELKAKQILAAALKAKQVKGKGLVPSDEHTQGFFDKFLVELNKRILKAEEDKKQCIAAKKEANLAMKTFKKSAGPGDIDEFQARFDKAAAFIQDDNNYVAAGKEYEAIKLDLATKQNDVRNAKTLYEDANKEATKALADLKLVTSDAVHARYEGRLHASQRDGELGEYQVALDALTTLTKDIKDRTGEAAKAKADWGTNPLRAEIANKAKSYREGRGENPYYTLVANLDGELGVIESTAKETRDFQRAGRELLALKASLKDREATIEKLAGKIPQGMKERSDMANAQAELDDKLDALSEAFGHAKPKDWTGKDGAFIRSGDEGFRGRIAAIKLAVERAIKTGDPGQITAAYVRAAKDYALIGGDVDKLLATDKTALDKYKEELKEERETQNKIAAARKLYGTARALAAQALLRLEDTGATVGFFRTDFDKFAEPGNISQLQPAPDLAEYTKKFDELRGDIEKKLKTNDTLVKDAIKKLQEGIKRVKTLCEQHSKDKSLAKYCACVEEEAAKLPPVLKSSQIEVLGMATQQADKLVKRLEALNDTKKQQELVAQRVTLAKVKKLLKSKNLKKLMPNTRADLLVAVTKAEELVYSGEPAAVQALVDLENKVNAAGTATEAIKKSLKTLDKKREEIKAELKALTKKIVAHAEKNKNFKGKDIKGTNFGDYQTRLDDIKIKAKGEDPKLFEEAIKLAEELSSDLPNASPALLAIAESKRIDKDKDAAEKWEWDLRTALNGDFKDAQEHADKTNDKSGKKMLDEILKRAKEAADGKDFRAARSQLEGLKRQASSMLGAAVGVHGSKKLEPLKAAWANSLGECRKKLGALSKAIVADSDITIGGQKLTDDSVKKQAAAIKKALAKFDKTTFDKPIDALLKEEDAGLRREAREQGLSQVRLYQRQLHEDPVMRVLNRKAFGVVVPLKALHDVLAKLDLLLQINN